MKLLKVLPVIGIALFVYIIWKAGIANIINTLGQGNLLYLGISAIFPVIAVVLQSIKWNLILKSQKINLDYPYTLRIQYIAEFLGLVTPARIGSFSKIFYLKKKVKKSFGEASSSVVMERMIDLVVVFVLAALGSLFLVKEFGGIFLVILISFALLIVALIIFTNKKICTSAFSLINKYMMPVKFKKYAKESFDAFYNSLVHPKKLFLPFIISCLAWIITYTQAYLTAAAFGITNLPYFISITLFSIATVASLIPISIGGFGVREATIIAIFSMYGISAPTLVVISLVWTMIAIVESLVGGLIAIKMEK